MVRSLSLLCVVALLLLPAGCNRGPDFTYGKAADKSVNGLSVFAELLRQRGHVVTQKSRITKRLDRFDTIVWAPDNTDNPPEDAVAWLEKWLVDGPSSRRLIYIGRDYDGKLPFYRSMVQFAPPQDRETWQRALNEQLTDRRDNSLFNNINTNQNAAWWYEEETDLDLDSTKLAGPWAQGINPQSIELPCDTSLKPMSDYNYEDAMPEYEFQEPENPYDYYYDENADLTLRDQQLTTSNLLTVDGKPFAFEVKRKRGGGGKLIVISNGSFLLNFPLANPECRKLASKVADEISGDVVFLESGWRWPSVGGEANDPKMQWSWIAQPPMNFIVPHFLFWGVLYCFAFYPNFGRPRRVQFHPPKAFRSHVKAVAAILGRSKETSWARQVVDMWLKRNNKTKG